MYDIIIIGAGPAGISAGLYTARANLKTLILYYNSSNLNKAENIQNYYGFEYGIKGDLLYSKGIKQAQHIGIETKKEEVIKIEIDKTVFKIITSKQIYLAKTVILALGIKKNKSSIPRNK